MFVTEHNPNHKGNVAELAIAKEAASLGLSVFAPLTEHERYDLVIGVAGRLLRVQCKWGAHKGDVICVRVGSCSHSPTQGYLRSTYDRSEIDVVAVYCGDLNRCYLLPVDLIAGQGAIHLRLAPARNNQRAALNLAVNYELRGAIAQLEERLTGSQEAVGSSPTSSIPSLADQIAAGLSPEDQFADLKKTVGMDEFYAKLAQYVRLAEAGEEIQVTRWGKPVARLTTPLASPPVP
jgi:prevent-host-death family protein